MPTETRAPVSRAAGLKWNLKKARGIGVVLFDCPRSSFIRDPPPFGLHQGQRKRQRSLTTVLAFLRSHHATLWPISSLLAPPFQAGLMGSGVVVGIGGVREVFASSPASTRHPPRVDSSTGPC